MEAGCAECSHVKETQTHEANQAILHTSAQLVCGPIKSKVAQKEWKDTGKSEWKKNRNRFVQTLKQQVSALRNSGGGIVFVHIKDLDPEDKCLDYFHELVDVKLNDMIEDGSLFVNIYNKQRLGEVLGSKDFVSIIVSPSVSVVTLDYKTKLPLDNSIIDPSGPTILRYLSHEFHFTEKKAILRGLDDDVLTESRQVQVKTLFITKDKEAQLKDTGTFVDYIWEELRLREYITSFSKIDGGGSFYVGIQEEERDYETYSTKRLTRKGFKFPLSEISTFIDLINTKVKDETVILEKDNNRVKFVQSSDFIKVAFHQLPEIKDHYILEVAVAAVAGVVFYDSQGPEAYEIDEDATDKKIKRICLDDWYRRLCKQFQN